LSLSSDLEGPRSINEQSFVAAIDVLLLAVFFIAPSSILASAESAKSFFLLLWMNYS
jgi:hypothetical protein